MEPQRLESLLEALAQVSFPINPQIYHDAALVYRYADGRREGQSATLVEFPAYRGGSTRFGRRLTAYGFPADCLHAVSMLDDIQAQQHPEPAPAGAPYVSRYRVKHRAAECDGLGAMEAPIGAASVSGFRIDASRVCVARQPLPYFTVAAPIGVTHGLESRAADHEGVTRGVSGDMRHRLRRS